HYRSGIGRGGVCRSGVLRIEEVGEDHGRSDLTFRWPRHRPSDEVDCQSASSDVPKLNLYFTERIVITLGKSECLLLMSMMSRLVLGAAAGDHHPLCSGICYGPPLARWPSGKFSVIDARVDLD